MWVNTMKNKPLFILILIFSVINIIDLITAMFIIPGEANPVYLLFKSPIVLIILKFVLIGLVWAFYKKNEYPSKFWYYTFVYILITGIVLYGFGTFSNIYGMLNPRIIETSAQLTTVQKISYYNTVVLFFAVIPYVLGAMAFKLYSISEKYVKYKKKKNGIKRNRK